MQILWVCDPWAKINHPTETTLRLIEESILLGHVNWFCKESDIYYSEGKVSVRARLLKNGDGKKLKIAISSALVHSSVDAFQYVYLRVDPPFKSSYRAQLQLLLTHSKLNREISIVNHPAALLTVNSKIICTYFKQCIPETLITSNKKAIKQFCKEKGTVVIKPTDGSLSRNVKIVNFKSTSTARRAEIFLKTISSDFKEPIVLQECVTSDKPKEIRAWFSNGKLIETAEKKIDKKRAIFDPFASKVMVSKYQVTQDDLKVFEVISSFMKKERLSLAAVDLVNGKIIDFNISSPGLLVEFENALKKNIAKDVLLNSLL